jgi:DNA-binding transcriptional MerR regulator
MTARFHFSAGEAARLAGMTPSMVDYLCRTKVLVPSLGTVRGRGRARQYSFGDVVVLRLLSRLLESGISVLRMKRGLQALRKRHPEITPASLPANYVVTDGITIYLRHGKDRLEEAANGQGTFAFVLELARVRAEVIKEVKADTSGLRERVFGTAASARI